VAKTAIAAGVIVGIFTSVALGGPAFAGEVDGNGNTLPLSGNSFCKYSGQNDDPDDPVEGGRVQSWGQLVRIDGYATAVEIAASFDEGPPGESCNGHLNPAPKGPLHP
jgi:hypothetical protein